VPFVLPGIRLFDRRRQVREQGVHLALLDDSVDHLDEAKTGAKVVEDRAELMTILAKAPEIVAREGIAH